MLRAWRWAEKGVEKGVEEDMSHECGVMHIIMMIVRLHGPWQSV
jgi:hypothetical protein